MQVALCGSDINLYKWNATARVIAELPFIPGKNYNWKVLFISYKCISLKKIVK